MNKKLIKLTEADLHKIVKQSVNRILKEDIQNGRKEFERQVMKWEDDLERISSSMKSIASNPKDSIWGSTASQEELMSISEAYKYAHEAYMQLVYMIERFGSYKREIEPEEKPFGFADEEY